MNIAYYKSEINKNKAVLNNNIQFKKQKNKSYEKKSIEVLKLEALKDEVIKDIVENEKWLKTNPSANTEKCVEISKRIEQYELSLENLKKIREQKAIIRSKIEKFNQLQKEAKKLYDKMNKIKKFLEIYFKIFEQKGKEFCGNDFKFKIYSFNEFELNEIFEVYYKDVNIEQLNKNQKNEVDKILMEKFEIYV